MKPLGIILGSLFLVIALVVATVNVVTWYKSTQYEDTAVPYIKTAIPVLSKWDAESIKEFMAPKVLEQTTDENFSKIIKYFSNLGSLNSFEEPEFSDVYTGTNPEEGTQTIVNYTVDAVYENGDAVITISLLKSGNSFKIYKFHISSRALVGQPVGSPSTAPQNNDQK